MLARQLATIEPKSISLQVFGGASAFGGLGFLFTGGVYSNFWIVSTTLPEQCDADILNNADN